MFNVNRRNNQFLYAGTVLDGDDRETWAKPHGALAEPLSSNSNSNSNTSPKITSVLKYIYKGIPLLYSTITPGAYELNKIAELIKEETDGNVIIEPDKNTMKCIMEKKKKADLALL